MVQTSALRPGRVPISKASELDCAASLEAQFYSLSPVTPPLTCRNQYLDHSLRPQMRASLLYLRFQIGLKRANRAKHV